MRASYVDEQRMSFDVWLFASDEQSAFCRSRTSGRPSKI
jgi:hypothetical protein